MDDLLKKIEKEIVDEYIGKLDTHDGAHKTVAAMVKISAEVTRKFIEQYELEKTKNLNH